MKVEMRSWGDDMLQCILENIIKLAYFESRQLNLNLSEEKLIYDGVR